MLKFGVGPYLAYALHGSYSVKSQEENKITFTNHGITTTTTSYETYYKRFDGGVNGFVEISTNNFYWQAGTSFGLFNIKPPLGNGRSQAIYRNRSINLSYGFRF
jgi:hypothetical protein